ncbi:MAG: EAL domain-containing protein [Pseudomonas sp.]|uniref:putative bifunctional diguanylate cyclase/phosphodiesterase n=1 Tax=Pseudomonas sp. TaxID=306 RepID=UPI0027354DFF|nr:EAL domain-containing protein [Pseudomonas sp.]MDP3848176.1 EAL domain-containing protein [Pseudomonas sp.]
MESNNPSLQRQSIAKWTLLRLGILLLLVGSGFFLVSSLLLAQRFDAFEAAQYRQELARVRAVIEQDSQALSATISDYAAWDASYRFIHNHDPAYLEENFTVESLTNLRVDGVVILDLAGQALAALALTPDTVTPLAPALLSQLTHFAEQVGTLGPKDRNVRVLWQGETAILVVLAGVTDTDRTQPSNGRLLMFRYLDGGYLKRIAELTAVAFRLLPVAGNDAGTAVEIAQQGDHWAASQLLADLGVRISVSGPGRLTAERQVTNLVLAANALLLVLLSLLGIYAILNRRVLQRLADFSSFADQRRDHTDAEVRWPVAGRDELDNLATSLNELMDEVEHQHSDLRHLADHDPLTGLGNRRLLMERLQAMQSQCRRQPGLSCVLLLIDLDSFKLINDGLGHAAGDWVLQQVAVRIGRLIRGYDTAVRLGGDEFALLLRDIDAAQALTFAQRMEQALEVPVSFDGRVLTISASTGIAQVQAELTPAEVLRNADLAMYEAKRLGKMRVAVFDSSLLEVTARRLRLEQALRGALDDVALEVWFQPIIDHADGRVAGMEALVRWPVAGRYIPPDEFIGIAESTGMITKLGAFVLDRACAALHSLRGAYPNLSCNVNLSVRQFVDTDLLRDVHACLRTYELPPSALHLELTESMVAEHESDILPTMQALVASGLRFHLDDFGTGYSSLDRLRALPIDTLKIDRSFVTPLRENDDVMARNIINLGHELGLAIIAEGVETEDECARLLALGCTQMQGYLFAKPMPFTRLCDWLSTRSTPQHEAAGGAARQAG